MLKKVIFSKKMLFPLGVPHFVGRAILASLTKPCSLKSQIKKARKSSPYGSLSLTQTLRINVIFYQLLIWLKNFSLV